MKLPSFIRENTHLKIEKKIDDYYSVYIYEKTYYTNKAYKLDIYLYIT